MKKRLLLKLQGLIQGVGFRPFVFKIAKEQNLSGFVQNTLAGIEIEIQSSNQRELDNFCFSLINDLPPLARIDNICESQIEAVENEDTFFIKQSDSNLYCQNNFAIIPPPDTATCNQCLNELNDPKNRRYRYPFLNCIDCGPRFTIITSLPYDRPNTCMSKFIMCSACKKEYDDPYDRRFHAQPNACSVCGPQLIFMPDNTSGENALQKAVAYLKEGKILALKGLGGYQLLCDAFDSNAVSLLRQRKNRPDKPLAIMAANIEQARLYCMINKDSHKILEDQIRPILLLTKRKPFTLAENISFDLDKIGVMLPTTALHHLILAEFQNPLICTSGNISEEPIAKQNEEALIDLQSIADGFLMHNREIISRYDDSVLSLNGQNPTCIRRARGYAPSSIELPFSLSKKILALGGHLKNTFSLGQSNKAIMSQHLGDLDHTKSLENYSQSLELFEKMFNFKPEILAFDLHPDYATTNIGNQLAKKKKLPKYQIQHHHAHIASCMVEHRLNGPVIGVAFDGFGMGTDNTLWGGEFFLATYQSFERLAHFKTIAIPGGSKAIKEPWRIMLGLIHSLDMPLETFETFMQDLQKSQSSYKINLVQKQIEQKFNMPLSSSCGRLFDACSSLLGICNEQSYEGQAPALLESIARKSSKLTSDKYQYEYDTSKNSDTLEINSAPIFIAMAKDMTRGVAHGDIALKFHLAIKSIIVQTCKTISKQTACKKICLSGGVFQNSLLLDLTQKELAKNNFEVYSPINIPCNDGGLSLGQLAIASHLE